MARIRVLAAATAAWFVSGSDAAAQTPPSAAAPTGTAFTLTISRVIKNGPEVTLVFHGIAADGAARLDVAEGTDAASFRAGSYLLVADSSGAARLVDTVSRTVRSIGAGARLGGLVEPFTPAGVVTDVVVKLDSSAVGEFAGGRVTRHYHVTTRFSLALDNGKGQPAVAQSSSVTELWQAEGPERIPNPFVGLGGDGSGSDFLAPLNEKLRILGRRLPGVTMRSDSRASLAAQGSVFTNVRVRTELSDIRPATVEAAALRIPAGYRVEPE